MVRPTGQHLAELRPRTPARVAVDPAKARRLHRALDPYFAPSLTERVEYTVPVTRQESLDLMAMTPSARHVSRADLKAGGLLPTRVTVSVLATAYRRR